MQKKLMTGVSAAALALCVTTASADNHNPMMADAGWYVSLFGGVSILHQFDNDYIYTGTPFSTHLHTEPGFVLGLAVGRQVWDSFRADVEVAYANNDSSSFKFDGFPTHYDTNGDVESLTVLGNLWYDHDMGSGITPYVGGGIGFGVVWGDYDYTPSTGPGQIVDGSDVGFAFQAGAGINYALTESLDLTVGYRFKGILDLSLNSTFVGSGDKKGDLYSHNVFGGIIWRFMSPY